MNKKQLNRLKLLLGVILALGALVGFVTYALRQNISLYFTPSQALSHEAPILRMIRMGGMVKKGSLVFSHAKLDVKFDLTDFHADVEVHYHGILPDLFREEQGVVVRGMLQSDGRFDAEEVLAKHDENYMPAEVRDSLRKQK
jgi:cytochrome c-type biogenesis protein CcmE